MHTFRLSDALLPMRWSTAARLALVGAVIVALSVALTASLVVRQVEEAVTGQAQNRLDVNMALARDLLRNEGGDGPVRLEGDHLVGANGQIIGGTTALVDKVRDIAGGTATLFRHDLRVSTNVLNPDGTRATGTHLAAGPVYDAVLKEGRTYHGEATILGTNYFTAYEPLKDAQGAPIGIIYVGVKKDDDLAILTRIEKAAMVSGAVLILIGGLALFASVRRAFGPLRELRAVMADLANGRLDTKVPALGRADEIGQMARAVQVFKDNAVQTDALAREQAASRERRAAENEQVRSASEQVATRRAASLVVGSIGAGLERLAAGDLTYRLETALPEPYEKLRVDLNTTMAQLQTMMGGVVDCTGGIRTGSTEIARAADNLSQRTERQAASLEETAAAVDHITATVHRTAENAARARSVTTQTRADAERSSEVVQEAMAAMDGIQRSSREIGQIIAVIDEIAFQTNLLALNAGVEAARAGDAGRGFAVVASEVRALAQRSAQAAKEIHALVASSTQQVGSGVKLVVQTADALARMAAQVGDITAAVSDIAASSQDQAIGLREVNAALNQIDHVTQENVAMVERSTAASHDLRRGADELVRMTGRFQITQTQPASSRPDDGSTRLGGARVMSKPRSAAA